MKLFLLLISFFAGICNVSAHNAIIKGHNNFDSKYISFCNGMNYGYHKQKGSIHWHEVEYLDGEWRIVDASNVIYTNPCNPTREPISFKDCVDGDTAVFMVNNESYKYRFLAVDTPESVHPSKQVEYYSKEAANSTCDLLANAESIEAEYDENSDRIDKYGRTLAWIWIDGILLQNVMVSEGLAKVSYIYGNYKYIDQLCSLEKNAIAAKKGIWEYDNNIGYCETRGESIVLPATNELLKVTFLQDSEKKEVSIIKGTKVNKTSAPKEKEKKGFKFVCWGYGDNCFDFDELVNADLTLKAKYKVDYFYYIIIAISIIIIIIKSQLKRKKYGKRD